jgi:hypothetical protein
MPNLFNPHTRSGLEARVRCLDPDSARRWGRMSPHQAICHLSDGLRMVLGEKTVASRTGVLAPMMRFVALHTPLPWPRGIKTLPEAEQGIGGTPPLEFERDRADLLILIDRFCCARADDLAPRHPMFGPMKKDEWGTWGYRHLDHHLRQFGV